MRRFSHHFVNLEARIWHNLLYNYYSLKKEFEHLDDEAFRRGYVVYINQQHTRKGRNVAVYTNIPYDQLFKESDSKM